MSKFGVQMMMLKESVAEIGAFETLKKVQEIGFSAFEVSQVPMTPENVGELERARSELGVEFAALSAPVSGMGSGRMETLETDFDKIVADCRRLGSTMLRIPILPFPSMGSLEAVLEFCDLSNEMARRLADLGIGLYYHNHHVEFAKYDGRLLLDIIVDRAPLLGLEIDVHWVQRAGLDPVAVLGKYSERVALVHLKDYRIAPVSQAAFDALARQDYKGFHQEFRHETLQFAEVGEGNLDFRAIIDESLRIGARYLIVEQDELYGRTPFESLQTSRDNLIALGYDRLF